MHILIGFITLLAAAAAWYWRFKMISGAAREIGGLARDAANLPRRLRFTQRARQGGLKVVEDPREAAAILMALVGRREGDVSEAALSVMQREVEEAFEFDEEESGGLVRHALWMVREVVSPRPVVVRMSRVVLGGVSPKEVVDLDSILVAVSEADGAPTADQLALLQTYRNTAGLVA